MRTISLLAAIALARADDGASGDFAARAAGELARATAELAAGHAVEALAAAELGLQYAPESRELIDAAVRAATAAGRRDDALFWTWELRERGEAIDPIATRSKDVAARYESAASTMVALGRRFAAEKLPENAADLARGARLTRFSAEPSGGARNPRLADWAGAREKETAHYLIRTDVDATLLDDVATAIEAMNRLYREHFRPRSELKRVTIRIYASREEFDEHEPGTPPQLRGFYSPDQNAIALYDPRRPAPGGESRPIQELWSTLFHEAAHPFTREVTRDAPKDPLPGWLSEGSASFFEGCRFTRGGSIRTGCLPRARLRELAGILDAGRPGLQQVIACRDVSPIPGSHYPVAWGLVEFLIHYQDEQGEHPYRKGYRDFLDSWRTPDDRVDAQARFVEHFIQRPRRPGVASFEDFERLWSRWIRDLATRTLGGPEQADAWSALARRQLELRDLEGAAASLRNALEHRPGDPALELDLADVSLQAGDRDGGVLHARRGLATDRPAVRERAVALLARVDPKLAKDVVAAFDELTESAGATATLYAEGGLPRCARRRIDEAKALLCGADGGLETFEERLALDALPAESARWRRRSLQSGPAWPDPTGDRYVVEADVDPGSGESFAGLVFGESEHEGPLVFALSAHWRLTLMTSRTPWDGTDAIPSTKAAGPVRLQVEVELARAGRHGGITCRLDGTVVRKVALDAADFLPRIGAVVSGDDARVTDLRWRE